MFGKDAQKETDALHKSLALQRMQKRSFDNLLESSLN